ncbi:hypothetical protein T492DRAFT_888426 [Pavlovales sp. CCMP2436]|nr:hypothetical protein T492DRAFT_888426 [Pavlovales sp. CCMP2436]
MRPSNETGGFLAGPTEDGDAVVTDPDRIELIVALVLIGLPWTLLADTLGYDGTASKTLLMWGLWITAAFLVASELVSPTIALLESR